VTRPLKTRTDASRGGRSGAGALFASLLLGASGFAQCPVAREAPDAEPPPLAPAIALLERPVSFEADVEPVLEGRCVVCHGCYDAPCQLLLSSEAGAARGASKRAVYDSSRLRAAEPARLFVDAQTPAQWREKGFFPVLPEAPARGGDGAPTSALLGMLALARAHPFAAGEPLPAEVGLDITRKLSCPAGDELEAYAREHPQGGMPYGMAPLADAELRVLATWAARGAAPRAPRAIPKGAAAQVSEWERFLNGDSLEERIVGRYLYEHWFVAHLYFESAAAGPFFRIVRSRTAPGEPIDEIATLRPYDDPGDAPFWYRLRPLDESIVHKTHITLPLAPARMRRLRGLFLAGDWRATRLPSYDTAEAANPFVAFDQIPTPSRYAFLLDDAHYFVMTFIRGPVCRGEVAVDVIEDRFFVAFLDPDRDVSVVDPGFLDRSKKLLELPAEQDGRIVPGDLYLRYARKQRAYLDAREKAYDAIDPEHRGPALDWIWDGDGTNPNALLTVFRNFDNATVLRGFVGAIPKTAWVMDYPIFERIYYDLVAGFDVFGSVAHQVATRLYMDHLRMQSENLFLGFLPADRRERVRASWYVGATRQLDYFFVNRIRTLDHGTQVPYRTDDPKAELLEQILARAAAVAGPPDLLNRCAHPPCDRPAASAAERAAERALAPLAEARGGFVAQLPEVSLLRVKVDASGKRDLVYSLVHDRAHTNVAFLFREESRLVPEDDALTLVRGHFGSYPNFLFEVAAEELPAFVSEVRAATTPGAFTRLAARHGVRRTDPRFWPALDWLHADLRRRDPTEAGLYDLGRYGNW